MRRRKLVPLALLSCALLGALATQQPAQAYPRVADLKPFSAEASYMSLAGFLRYRIWVLDGVWVSRRTAAGIVRRQIATGED